MLDLPVGTAKTRIRDGLIRLRDTMGVGRHERHPRPVRRLRRRRPRRHRARPVRAAPGRLRRLPQRGRRRLREAAALLAETTAAEPSAGLRDRVLADIATVRPLPPVAEPAERPSVGSSVADFRRWSPPRRPSSPWWPGASPGSVIDDPHSRYGPGAPGRRRRASSPRRSPVGPRRPSCAPRTLNQAVLVTEDMPAAPDGHSYALWLQHDDGHGAGRDHAERRRQPGPAQRRRRARPTAPGSPSRPRARSTTSPSAKSSPSSSST